MHLVQHVPPAVQFAVKVGVQVLQVLQVQTIQIVQVIQIVRIIQIVVYQTQVQ
jgi:hypothetical protein